LENLNDDDDDGVNINRAWKSVTESEEISGTETVDYYELK